jgi:hypothetical protein
VDAALANRAVDAMSRRLVGAGAGPAERVGDAIADRLSVAISNRMQLSDEGRDAFARLQESPDDETAKDAVIRALKFELARDQVFAKTIENLLSGKVDPAGSELGPIGTLYESERRNSGLPGLLTLGVVALVLIVGIAVATVVLPAKLAGNDASTATTPAASAKSAWRSLAVLNVRANDLSFNAPWGDMLATADVAGTVTVWRTATHKKVATFDATNGSGATGGDENSVAFNAAGNRLVAGGLRGTIEVWNISTGKLVRTPFGNKNTLHAIYGVAFAPDGKTVASASQDGTVRIWDAATGQQQGNPIVPTKSGIAANAVAYSPNGRLLATLSDDGTVAFWDPTTHQKIREADAPATTVGTAGDKLAFRPDSKVLATVSAAGLHLWDTRTGRTISAPANDAIGACAYKGDGTVFATGSVDGTVRTFQPNTLALAGNVPGDLRYVDAIAFSKSGPYLAAADSDSQVHLWTSQK